MKKKFKKWIAPAAFGLFGLGLVPSAMAENPIFQTYYSPDPAPVVFGDTVCVYTGNDEGGSFFTMHGWRVSCSTDMVNWQDMGELILQHSDFNGSAKANGDWAAQVIRRNGKYYYYVTVESSRGGRAVNVAVADRPEGPFKDALNGKHLAGPNWDYIDPTVWIDDDGQAYLYWGNPKLYYAKLNEDMISFDRDGIKVTDMSRGFAPNGEESKYTEGPWIHKRGKKYYMIYASHGVPEKISYSTSDSPTGPWTWGGVIMDQGNGTAFTNHSGLIDFKGRSFFFYHNQKNVSGGGYSRSTAVEEFTWNADGSIPTIKSTNDGVKTPIKNLDPYERVEAETKAWVGGINVDKTDGYTIIKHVKNENGCVYLTNMGSDFYTKVRSVDMSDGADKITMVTRGKGGKMELHMGGLTGTLLATMNIPASTAWEEHSFDVSGADGVNDLYFVVKQGGFDFDYWYFESEKQAVPQEPFNGVAAAIPGKIQAEEFDKPGVGRGNQSFSDKDAENHGDSDFRKDDAPAVDLYKKGADGKRVVVGYIQEGEWLEYTVDIAKAGDYTMYAAVASAGGSTFKMSLDGEDITDKIEVPKAAVEDSYDEYAKVKANVTLPAGKHILRFTATGDWFDVDYFNFESGKDAEDKAPIGDDPEATDPTPGDNPDGINGDVHFAKIVDSSYDVFGLTGKFMGRVDLVGGDIKTSLSAAGFGKGVYMVRGANSHKFQKVNMDK